MVMISITFSRFAWVVPCNSGRSGVVPAGIPCSKLSSKTTEVTLQRHIRSASHRNLYSPWYITAWLGAGHEPISQCEIVYIHQNSDLPPYKQQTRHSTFEFQHPTSDIHHLSHGNGRLTLPSTLLLLENIHRNDVPPGIRTHSPEV